MFTAASISPTSLGSHLQQLQATRGEWPNQPQAGPGKFLSIRDLVEVVILHLYVLAKMEDDDFNKVANSGKLPGPA